MCVPGRMNAATERAHGRRGVLGGLTQVSSPPCHCGRAPPLGWAGWEEKVAGSAMQAVNLSLQQLKAPHCCSAPATRCEGQRACLVPALVSTVGAWCCTAASLMHRQPARPGAPAATLALLPPHAPTFRPALLPLVMLPVGLSTSAPGSDSGRKHERWGRHACWPIETRSRSARRWGVEWGVNLAGTGKRHTVKRKSATRQQWRAAQADAPREEQQTIDVFERVAGVGSSALMPCGGSAIARAAAMGVQALVPLPGLY